MEDKSVPRRFPKNILLSNHDVHRFALNRELKTVVAAVEASVYAKAESDLTDPDVRQLAIYSALAAASMVIEPPIIYGRVCLSRIRPYWTSYALTEEFSGALRDRFIEIVGYELYSKLATLEAEIRSGL
jgi:hypothetical protein